MVAKSKKQPQPVQELTDEEWHELVDRAARHFMNMSGEEFKRRWEAGEYPDPDHTPGVMAVAMLLPDVGRDKSMRQTVEHGDVAPAEKGAVRAKSRRRPHPTQELNAQEWHELIDRAARRYLGLSADEFIRRWESGEYPDPDGTPVMRVAMLLPSVG